MDEAKKAPQSEFSGQSELLRTRIERAVAELCAGADAAQALEALQDEADQAGLADAYAGLLRESELSEVPRTARLELFLQAAWCCSQQEGQELATLQAATLALDLAPADERALALLEPLLLESEEYSELSNRYAVAATNAGSEAKARQLLERAIHMLAPLAAATPAVVGLRERLERLPSVRDGDDALLAIAHGPAGAEQGAALIKLAERWLSGGLAREGAEKLQLQISALQGDAVLDALERLFDQADDEARFEQTLHRRAQLEPSALGRARALEKLAAFYQQSRADKPRACEAFSAAAKNYAAASELDDAERAYQRLLELAPDDVSAATALLRLRAAAGDFAAVASAFAVVLRACDDNRAVTELVLDLASDAERSGAAEEFAELSDSVLWRLSDAESALAARLLRTSARLFAVATRYDEAAELYRRLIADQASSEDLDGYQALIEAHPGSEWRHHQQRWLFEWQEHHSSDRPTVLLSWARFEEHELGDPQAALQVLGRAAELAPDRPEIWESLARLRLSEGDGAGGLLAAGQLRRLGRELDVGLLSLLLEQEPTARWALDRVKLTLSAEQRWPELFVLYDRAIDATADERARAELLDEAAIAARDVAQDRGRALVYWEQHATLAPGDARIELALDRLYEHSGDTAGLIAHTRRRLARAVTDARPALLRKLASLSLETSALDDALAAALELAEQEPLEAQEFFERVLARSLELAEPAAQPAGVRAAQLLRSTPATSENAGKRARLLRAELSLTSAAVARQALLLELSRLLERELSDHAAAFDAIRELFLLTRSEKDRKRLERLATKSQRFGELCQAYVAAALGHDELGERQSLLLRAARTAAERVRDPELARRLFRQLFEQAPAHAVAAFEALGEEPPETSAAFAALCELLEGAQRFAELGQVLARAAEQGQNAELLARLARLQAERLGAPASAIATYLSANDARAAAEVFLRMASVFAEDSAVVVEMSRRLVSVGEPELAARVLRHQLACYGQRSSPPRKLAHLELVQVLEGSGASDLAAQELAEIARHFPTDTQVQRACAASAAAREDWDRAEQSYRALLLLLHGSGAEHGLRRASVYVALFSIKRRRSQEAEAAELLESAFEIALGSPAELSALAQSLLEEEQWQAADRACIELSRLAYDPEQLAPSERLGAELARSGALLASPNSDSRAAGLLQLERLVERPEAPMAAWSLLARAWEAGSETHKLTSALSALLEREPSNSRLRARALDNALRLGDLSHALEQADHLQRAGSAVALETLGELRRLCVRGGETERAAGLLTLEARRERVPAKRAALLVEAAELRLASGHEQAALSMATEARALDETSPDAVLLLAKLALARGERDEALALLTGYAESKERKRGKPLARVLRLAADLRLEQDELSEALPLLQEAHQLDKTDLDTALLLGLLAIDLDRLDTAASALRVLIAQRELGTREGAAAHSLNLARGYFQLARIEHHNGKKTNAKRMALRALEEDPSLAPARRLLSELGLS